MPNVEPYRAWATFSFTASSDRINECDLLIAVPGGLYLLELKGHPGRVVNHGETWSFSGPGSSRARTLRNPLHFTDGKSKDLKNRFVWAAGQLRIRDRLPRLEPAVFLSDPGLRSGLDDVQKERVYGRDDAAEGLPWIWKDLLSRPPQREQQRITPHFAGQVLPRSMEKIGIRVSRRTPQLDGHVVEVVDGSERLVLDGDFLDGLRNAATTAVVRQAGPPFRGGGPDRRTRAGPDVGPDVGADAGWPRRRLDRVRGAAQVRPQGAGPAGRRGADRRSDHRGREPLGRGGRRCGRPGRVAIPTP